MAEEPADRFHPDPPGREHEEDALGVGGQVLNPSVTVEVVRVGRPPGRAHGDQGEGRRHHVKTGVGSLAEEPEAAGQQPDDQLSQADRSSNEQRSERDLLGSA